VASENEIEGGKREKDHGLTEKIVEGFQEVGDDLGRPEKAKACGGRRSKTTSVSSMWCASPQFFAR
jgi:hypothetical protein